MGYERLVALIVGWIAATGPAHRDALLFIGSRNLKIVIRNAHLFEASLWFACAHVALFQEMIIWSNQIFAEVEIIVVHPCWKDQAAWASAVVVEVFRVLERNERIFHAVHQKRGARDIANLLDILESILYKVLQNAAGLILGNSPDGFEGRHQKQ